MQSHTAGKDSRFPNAQFFLISTPCLCLTQPFPAAGFAGRRDVSGGGRIRQSTSPQRSFVCCRGFFCDEQGSVLRPFPTLFSGQFVCAPVGSFGFLVCFFLRPSFVSFPAGVSFWCIFCFPFLLRHNNETTDAGKTNWNSGRVSPVIVLHRLTRRATDQGHAGRSASRFQIGRAVCVVGRAGRRPWLWGTHGRLPAATGT